VDCIDDPPSVCQLDTFSGSITAKHLENYPLNRNVWYIKCVNCQAAYLPPDQPVLTSHPVAPCFCIFSDSMAAYLVGCIIINAAPKQAENVACGSLIPSSVPATCLGVEIITNQGSLLNQESNWPCQVEGESRTSITDQSGIGLKMGQVYDYQSCITTDKVIHGLCQAQLAHRWEHAKCITCQ
jgi:hypothetical protein